MKLATYAIPNLPKYSQRVLCQEKEHPYKNPFQRDRDRILHSKAFRRLGYKTQVFVNSAGDIYRTRLTHTFEVSQVVRSICRALSLNQDLAEAIALAHDVGHTPFAHAGQEALNLLMKEDGGFEHNCQTLRQLNKLERKYLSFPGLNLTRETSKGMMKRSQFYECDPEFTSLQKERKETFLSLEAYVVDLCDHLTYVHHDLEDGIEANLIHLDQLNEMNWWKEAKEAVEIHYKKKWEREKERIWIHSTIRYMMDQTLSNLIETSKKKLAEASNFRDGKSLLTLEKLYQDRISILSNFLRAKLYKHYKVEKMAKEAHEIIRFLFSYYLRHPKKMPMAYQELLKKDPLPRVVSDYIAGMTDRFAQNLYKDCNR